MTIFSIHYFVVKPLKNDFKGGVQKKSHAHSLRGNNNIIWQMKYTDREHFGSNYITLHEEIHNNVLGIKMLVKLRLEEFPEWIGIWISGEISLIKAPVEFFLLHFSQDIVFSR